MFEFIGNVIMFIPNLIMSLISGIWHILISVISFPISFVLGILKFLFTPITALFLFLSPGNVNVQVPLSTSTQTNNIKPSSYVVQERLIDIKDAVRHSLNYDAFIEKKGSTIIASINDERIISPDIYAENIVDGVCNYFDDDYSQLKGIKEIEVLNKFSYQGYVFEHPEKSCPKVHESYSELWAYTHQHTNY